MIDELEALVGHVFVVGGRAVSATPPGARVELPPKKAQRGREQDTFFTLVTPAGANQGQAPLYEQLARLAADLYFHSGGGVTSGLREAVSAVNSHLIEHNENSGQRFEANMACVVMRGREVYVARTGSCICLYRQGDSFLTFPTDLHDEFALNSLPLGYSPVPDIKLSHYDTAPGHLMVLSDAGFAQISRDELQAATQADSVQAAMEAFKALGPKNAQAMIIQFVSMDTPDPVVITPQPGILRSSAAPTSTPGVRLAATPTAPTPARPAAPVKKAASVKETGPEKKPDKGKSSAELVGAALAGDITLPPASEVVTETIVGATNTANRAGRRAAGGTASALGSSARTLNKMLDVLMPEPEESGPKIPGMLAAGLVILIPVVVVFIMVSLKLSQMDMTDFEKSVHDLQVAADQASAPSLSDADQIKTWNGIIQRIDDLEAQSGRTSDPTLAQIRDKGQAILDGYDKVTRRPTILLRRFGDAAKLIRPIIRGGGTDMYTLDTTLSAIYRDTLDPDKNIVLTRSASPIVQRGSAVGDGNTVQQLLDIIWLTDGGVPRGGNLLAALDKQGILVTYSPTFAPATSQRLPASPQWGKPIAMAAWQGRLYILDPDANQIWRYLPKGDVYPDAPEEYFDATQAHFIKNAVDFGIDSSGNVYVLMADGTLKKYNGGDEGNFAFQDLPDGPLKSASALYVDTDSLLPALYIADPIDESIYEVTLEGRFMFRYRSTDLNAFKNITGVASDNGKIYVTSGPAVYVFIAENVTPPTSIPPTATP